MLISIAFGPELTPQRLVEFIENGCNILLALSSSVSESVRDFARELDIDLASRNSLVVDHFHYADYMESNNTHTNLQLEVGTIKHIVDAQVHPVIYHGVGHSLGTSDRLVPILRAPRTAYSYDTSEEFDASEEPYVAGSQTFLVTGFQARNNARVIVSGSQLLFSDRYDIND